MGNNANELGLEQLVAIEEYVVAVPAAGGCDQARAKVCESQLEGLSIVSRDL